MLRGLPGKQFGELDPDVSQDGAPVFQAAVEVVGNGFEAVEFQFVHLAELCCGVGFHIEQVELLRQGFDLLRGEGLRAHEIVAGEDAAAVSGYFYAVLDKFAAAVGETGAVDDASDGVLGGSGAADVEDDGVAAGRLVFVPGDEAAEHAHFAHAGVYYGEGDLGLGYFVLVGDEEDYFFASQFIQ